jgi:NAD/NADP transhydrogenase beta subunit
VHSLPNTTLSLHPCALALSARGTVAGMVGMAVAIVATLYLPQFAGGSADYNFTKFFLPLGAGAALGTVMAARVEMMEMPELGMRRDPKDE